MKTKRLTVIGGGVRVGGVRPHQAEALEARRQFLADRFRANRAPPVVKLASRAQTFHTGASLFRLLAERARAERQEYVL